MSSWADGCCQATMARAQFMYQNGAGQRITLYLGAVKSSARGDVRETAFRFLGVYGQL
jgi:hypothetical protein